MKAIWILACAQAASADLGYGDPRGSAVLREVLAWVPAAGTSRCCAPRKTIISTGLAVINLFRKPGPSGRDVRGLRGPGLRQRAGRRNGPRGPDDGHPHHLRAGRRARPRGQRTGGQRSPRGRGHPAHQLPHRGGLVPGMVAPLLDLDGRGGGDAIEDDYDDSFATTEEPVGALEGLAPDQVFCSARPARHCARGSPRVGPRPFTAGLSGRRRQSNERPRLLHDRPACPGHPALQPAGTTATCAGCELSTPPAGPH